ncbi:hypothetical protein [Paenarthrobacter aurescens]|uniref:hypothetical protein n=1 Tax=Paenarthrobacter aurescens TaxID=43663 RepID=UPI0021BF641D|nr:hypothetical protein [Paenarthrobacter aurescens]MCT9867837.1 hypothetical protein [Paenarthrobacter aurescens]
MMWMAPAIGALLLIPHLVAVLPRKRASERAAGKADRLRLIASAFEIVAVLVFVRQLGTWTPATIALWYVVVALAASALAGMMYRSAGLPWITDNSSHARRILGTAAGCLVATTVIVVLLLP